MGGEGFALGCEYGAGIHEGLYRGRDSKGVTEAVGDGVVDENVLRVDVSRGRISHEIGHPVCEPGRYGKPAGIGVIFHVVLWRVREDDGGFNLPDHASDLSQGWQVVEDFKIIANGWMKISPEDASGGLGFREPHPACFVRSHFHGSTTTGGEVEIVYVEASLLQQEQSACPEVLDVIGVGKDGEGGVSHRVWFRVSGFWLPVQVSTF